MEEYDPLCDNRWGRTDEAMREIMALGLPLTKEQAKSVADIIDAVCSDIYDYGYDS